ncbi:Putative LOC100879604, partial [Caligus rogercresseyi]
ATRLGKHINELRRKAQDKLLANRAKSLVKKWRQLLVVQVSVPAAAPALSNGLKGRVHLSPVIRPLSNNGSRVTSPVAFQSLPSSASTTRNGSPLLDPVPKTNPANKRLRKAEDDFHYSSEENNSKRARSNGRTSSSKPEDSASSLLQRQMLSVKKASGRGVLTTQDLVQQLALRSQSPSSSSLPNNNNNNTTISSSNPPPPPDHPQEEDRKETNSQLMSRFFDSQSLSNNDDAVDDLLKQLPPINRDEILAEMEREFGGGRMRAAAAPPILPTHSSHDTLLNRLHSEQIESFSGNFDAGGNFHEWHEVVGKTSKEGDLLYVLPYCIID